MAEDIVEECLKSLRFNAGDPIKDLDIPDAPSKPTFAPKTRNDSRRWTFAFRYWLKA